jgi:hypothetical protein
MSTTREQAWQALFDRLAGATTKLPNGQVVSTWATASRRVKLMPDNTIDSTFDQPAMFLLEGNEKTTQSGRGTPSIRHWNGMVWIFAKVPDGTRPGVQDFNTPGASVLNPLLDAVEAALYPDNIVDQTLRLGNLVYRAWIEGETVKIIGDVNPDGQCFAAVPVKLLVP